MRIAIYALLLVLGGCGRLGQPAADRTLQLERLVNGLQQAWPGTYPLQMRVTVKGTAGHEYLHCQLGNRSGDALQLNQSALPWITPAAFDVTAVNDAGQVVTRTGFVSILTSSPQPIALGAGKIIAGDVALRYIPPLPRDQDLLLIWSYDVEMFGERQAFLESGIIFLPKTRMTTKDLYDLFGTRVPKNSR